MCVLPVWVCVMRRIWCTCTGNFYYFLLLAFFTSTCSAQPESTRTVENIWNQRVQWKIFEINAYSGKYLESTRTVENIWNQRVQWKIFEINAYSGKYLKSTRTVENIWNQRVQWKISGINAYSGKYLKSTRTVENPINSIGKKSY